MRATLLTGFGGILSLGASGTDANIICDTKQALGIAAISSSGVLHDANRSCTERVCTTGLRAGKAGGFFTDRCGQVVLTITYVEDSPLLSDFEDCITHFHGIVDQCIAKKSVRGGTVLTHDALYEAYIVNEEDFSIRSGGFLGIHDDKSTFEARDVGEVQPRVSKSKAKNQSNPAAKPKPAAKSRPALKPKPAPRPKPAPKTAPASKPQQDCNGKNPKSIKNTIRDVVDGFLPRILRRAPPPQGDASCPMPSDFYYRQRVLQDDKAWVYSFSSREGWQQRITDEAAKSVLTKMKPDGNFKVVILKSAKSYCVGNLDGKTNPREISLQSLKAGETCLFTNGNYFVMGAAKNLEFQAGGPVVEGLRQYDHFAVGFTSSTKKSIEIPADHANYYEKFEGDGDTSLMCGPSLMQPLDLKRPELQYWCERTSATTEHAESHPDKTRNLVQSVWSMIPGGIATSNEPNERLVTVIMKDGLKLVFAYTSRRSKGVNVNQMRDVVEAFLASFLMKDIGTDTKQVLNLDGGGSIYVAWVTDNEWKIIAAGNLQGRAPPKGWKPRTVTTMIKHTFE